MLTQETSSFSGSGSEPDDGYVKTAWPESEPPFVVHLIRMAGGLTLMAGVVLLVTAAPAVGVGVVLLSALYFALAEIINYLAIIARKREADHRFLADEGSEAPVGREVSHCEGD